MRLFLTGHTGFKGSWFSYCAAQAGAEVFGYSLAPVVGGFFEVNGVADRCATHQIADIRDQETLNAAIKAAQPAVIVHMAAQPLVRASYVAPRETIDTNVMGTLNVLEAARTHNVPKTLVITSDKVYRNIGSTDGYREDAALGGHDPYSASKAMAEILVGSWASSFPRPNATTQTARAGNVIGGGDRCEDRLLPDILAAVQADSAVSLRYPKAVRPWQHVLDVTSGYFAVIRNMTGGSSNDAWNLGPNPEDTLTVGELAQCAIDRWGRGSIEVAAGGHPHEEQMLTLDATKAKSELGWSTELTAREAVEWTVDWERAVLDGASAQEVTDEQTSAYTKRSGESVLSFS